MIICFSRSVVTIMTLIKSSMRRRVIFLAILESIPFKLAWISYWSKFFRSRCRDMEKIPWRWAAIFVWLFLQDIRGWRLWSAGPSTERHLPNRKILKGILEKVKYDLFNFCHVDLSNQTNLMIWDHLTTDSWSSNNHLLKILKNIQRYSPLLRLPVRGRNLWWRNHRSVPCCPDSLRAGSGVQVRKTFR